MNTKTLVSKLLKQDRLALARVISQIENRDENLSEIISLLYTHTGNAKVIGVTGPPGAGKSTLVNVLIKKYRKEKNRVAVIAIDPSSPFSGGAVLGDRIRMQDHANDKGVYIRSLGTRGQHGGLSLATKEVVWALDAAGFDFIIVETAGVGQTELSILKLAQTVLVVLVPESGDSIQVMKAGLMEIADLFLVNKSDRPEADKLVKELIQLSEIGQSSPSELNGHKWNPPVLKTEARKGKGVDEVMSSIERHQEFLCDSGLKQYKLKQLLKEEVFDLLVEQLGQDMDQWWETSKARAKIMHLVNKNTNPHKVATETRKSMGFQYLTKKV